MKRYSSNAAFVFGLLSLLFTTVTLAQSTRPSFDRPSNFDAQHYIIRVSFDRAKKRVYGDTTVILRPSASRLSTIELDAVDLQFESIVLEPSGIPLKYTVKPTKVVVQLDKQYDPKETISIRFRYTATPKKGVYFVPADGKSGRSDQIWTQGEPDEARHWFPSFDFPSDKATTEQFITVKKGETVIANGELVEKQETNDDQVTWHYKMPIPHSIYLLSFVVGKYIKIERESNGIPLGIYVYPGRELLADRAFGETGRMLSIFEQVTATKFPFNKYDQTIVSGFQFGGMENVTATTMADTEIFFSEFDFGKNIVTDLVSHELAHSWFGNLVTCQNWAELWLNEGFATFMEAVYREKAYGKDQYLRKIRADAAEFLVDDSINKKKHPLYNLRADNVNALFDNAATTYSKGSAVIHTLREQIGDEAFWRAVKIYLDRHKFANVTSEDLRKAAEEASGQDLKWFFEQWVYGAGAPKINVNQTYSAKTRTYSILITQTQTVDAITPGVFLLPFEISFQTRDGVVNEKVTVTKRSQTFTYRTNGKPTELIIDKEEKIPLKSVKISPLRSAKSK